MGEKITDIEKLKKIKNIMKFKQKTNKNNVLL